MRLSALAHQVPLGSRIVDVGTDHALLPIYLVENGSVSQAIATDVAEGPFQAAMANVLKHGLEEKISIRIGDGLAPVAPGEADVALIAGMGGSLAVQILSQTPAVTATLTRVVIQPMNAVELVRIFLRNHHYALVDEQVVFEDGRFYEVLTALTQRTVFATELDAYESFPETPSQLELAYYLGPLNLQRATPIFIQYAQHQLIRWQGIATSVQRGRTEESRVKLENLQARIQALTLWLAEQQRKEGASGDKQIRT